MEKRLCRICQKELKERQEKYCSISCADKGRKKDGHWRNFSVQKAKVQ